LPNDRRTNIADGLPDFYSTVAADALAFFRRAEGICVDLGSGRGGLGLALASRFPGAVILVDPNTTALARALQAARNEGVESRVAAVGGEAESLPLRDESVDLVVSRGSIFFWRDRARGLREVFRILRTGGKAMIGGGLGTAYPEWARREFIRRRREHAQRGGPDAWRSFLEARQPESFRRWAHNAELNSVEIVADGGFPLDDPSLGLGIWLRFTKEITNAQHR